MFHSHPKPLGVVKKTALLFVPPGVTRNSQFKPDIPESFRFSTTRADLDLIELAGFDAVIDQLKKMLTNNTIVEEAKAAVKVVVDSVPIPKIQRRVSTQRSLSDSTCARKRELKLQLKVLKQEAKSQAPS